jgi:hypothetical protein
MKRSKKLFPSFSLVFFQEDKIGGNEMHLLRILGFILIGVLACSPAFAEDDSYVCVAESAVGFDYNKTAKKWERSDFKTESKYVVSKSSEAGKGWEVKKIGQSEGISCGDGFDENGFIRCSGIIDFLMNNESLRYIVSHLYGYVIKEYPKGSQLEEGSLKPYLEIGRCSPL